MAENELGSNTGSEENLTAEAISLQFEELDNAEYAIPPVDELPSLESILMEPDCGSLSGTEDDIRTSMEKLGGSETASVGSHLSLNSINKLSKSSHNSTVGYILRHVILKGISGQIVSASERVNAGLASAVAVGGNMLIVGTSHGLVLAFDSSQTLRWCDQEARHQGSVSALCFNHDSSRLLVGYARGLILMIETSTGKVLRTLTDVHPPDTAVLHVKFTDSPKVALCSDSGGSVFELNFTRIMGVRGCESKCLFSGSRGEVCTLEPLLLNHIPSHPLKNYTLVAMATLSKVFPDESNRKFPVQLNIEDELEDIFDHSHNPVFKKEVIVVCIRPRIRVVLTHSLSGTAIAPPQVSWQLVVIQAADSSRVIDPVLALARDDVVHFYQVCTEVGSRVKLTPLRRMTLSYTISNLRWLNARSLIVLDTQERLHLLDVRTQNNLETLDMSRVGISYASSHFKGLSTGGNVSKAMALAGERACYNTVIVFGTQLILLGTKSLHAVCIRTWTERLRHLTVQKRFPEALALGLSFYQDKGKAVVGLRGSKQRRKHMARDKVCQVLIQYMEELNNCTDDNTEHDIVTTCVDYCVKLDNTELLFGKLWDTVSESEALKWSYLRALEIPLLDGSLPPRLPPGIAQQLIGLYDEENKSDSLQTIVVLLEVDCLDIHQVTTVCRRRCLWEALIHLQTVALGDYTAPIYQLVSILQTGMSQGHKSLSQENIRLGNALLVYASCCLAGRGFPRDELPEGMGQKAKTDVLRALLAQHSSLANETERQYPYIRTLLQFDARGFIDVVAIAFQEPEFTSEMGLRQRQRLIDILTNIVMPSTPINKNNTDYLSYEQRIVVLVFISNEFAESNISLESETLNGLIETLTSDPYEESSKDLKIDRENAILELLNSKKLTNISDKTLLNLAQRSNFMRIAELLYGAREDWSAVCRCMILNPTKHNEIWSWLERLPRSSLDSVVLAHASALIGINPIQFATIIVTRTKNKLSPILEKLNGSINSEYTLLSALYQVIQYKEEDTKFELTTALLERYLELMCKLEPENVVKHLQGSHGCRLDTTLEIVQSANHKEAEALMFEKLGDYQAAFDLLLKKFQDNLQMYYKDELSDDEIVQITVKLAGLCRRSAGNLDWMPLVDAVLSHCENNNQRVEQMSGKLLRTVLESLSGTTALSTVLEQILKHPSATSGTMGDIRQLLSGVISHSRYEQTLVETTAKIVGLELHEALKTSLRDSGRACPSVSLVCPICRQILSLSTNYVMVFGCGHGYHSECLGEPKSCYKCLKEKGWAPVTTSIVRSIRPMEINQISPPEFLRENNFSLRLAPPTLIPDLEGIL